MGAGGGQESTAWCYTFEKIDHEESDEETPRRLGLGAFAVFVLLSCPFWPQIGLAKPARGRKLAQVADSSIGSMGGCATFFWLGVGDWILGASKRRAQRT